MKRSGVLVILIVATAIIAIAAFASRGSQITYNARSQPSEVARGQVDGVKVEHFGPLDSPRESQAPSQETVAAALNDAALSNLITNYKVAASKGDRATQDALLSALRKHPAKSRELLSAELAEAEGAVASAIQYALKELQ